MRHARAGRLRGARRAAAAAAVFAARAQLLGQAQRACSRYCVALRRCRRRATSPSTIRCSRRSGARSRTSPASPKASSSPASTAARRRTTRCRWPARARAFARLAADADDAGLRRRAAARCADAMTAHPGDGLRRRAQRPRADARRRGDWVDQDRRRGRAGDRHPQPGHRASRSRSPTAPSAACIRRRSRCSTSWGCSTTRSARSSRRWREPVVRNYRGIVTGTIRPLVVLDKLPAAAATSGRGAVTPRRRELPARAVVCPCKRAPQCRRRGRRPGSGPPDAWQRRPDAAPAVRRA